jgi:hypothetical protein
MYTRSFGLSVSSGVTLTTTTRTITETAYETGCPLPQYTTTAGCVAAKRQFETSPTAVVMAGSAIATNVPALAARNDDWFAGMMDGCDIVAETVFYVKDRADDWDIDRVMARLLQAGLTHHRYQHASLGTIFIFAAGVPSRLRKDIEGMPGVSRIPPSMAQVIPEPAQL